MERREFVNRVKEFERLQESITNYDITFFLAQAKHGTSSFLEECKKKNTSSETILLKLNESINLGSAMLEHVKDHEEMKDILIGLSKEHFGSKSGSFFSALLACIPYVGNLLSFFVTQKSAPPIYSGNYNNALMELLLPVYQKYALEKKITILIDSAQFITESDLELIISLLSIINSIPMTRVSVVLAFIDNMDLYYKTHNYFRSYANFTSDIIYFKAPEAKMIKEIADAYSISLNEQQIQQLIISTKLNMHQIVYKMLDNQIKDKLSPMEEAAIFLLYIYGSNIEEQTLLKLLSKSNVFSQNFYEDACIAVKSLVENNLIIEKLTSEQHTILHLNTLNNPLLEKLSLRSVDIFYYEELIYRYFSSLVEPIQDEFIVMNLLYRLAKKYYPFAVSKYAIKLINIHLKAGTFINPDVIQSVNFEQTDVDDMRLAIMFYCREREYDLSLKLMEKYIQERSDLDILLPYLLDRTRELLGAEALYNKFIKSEISEEQRCILIACSIANSIHLHGEAYTVTQYTQIITSLEHTEHFGYIARNLASAEKLLERKLELYEIAIKNFRFYKDRFGAYSTLCNKGNVLCNNNKPEKALEFLLEAEKGLETFGQKHLHIVYNNLGMCYMMLKRYGDAIKYLMIVKQFEKNSMPRMTAEINLACCYIFINKKYEAQKIMKSIKPDIENHRVVNLKKKYYNNALLIEYAQGLYSLGRFMREETESLTQYGIDLNKYKDLVARNVEASEEHLHELYNPSGLAYWYVDPLKLIAE